MSFLFNVPEGFARLVLEHKVRPGTGLRAVMATNTQPGAVASAEPLFLNFECMESAPVHARPFLRHIPLQHDVSIPRLDNVALSCTAPQALMVHRCCCPTQGGLGGLILRLKQDGHGQVELLGPRGAHEPCHHVLPFNEVTKGLGCNELTWAVSTHACTGLGTSLEGVAEFVHWKHPHITLRELHPTTPSTRGIQPPPQTQQDGVMGAMSTAMAALQKRVALSTAVREEPLPEGTCFEDDLLQVTTCSSELASVSQWGLGGVRKGVGRSQ
eukprot:1159459-Pelagomonas_calceolata.AAC.10